MPTLLSSEWCLINRLSDVMAIECLIEGDLLHRFIGLPPCLLQGRRQCGDTQNAAAVRDRLSLLIELCPCMEAVQVLPSLQILQSVNDLSLFVGGRIPSACHDNAHRRIVCELQFHLVQRAVNAGIHHIDDVRLHPRQHHLRLRIAESGVVFHNLRAVLCQHQAENTGLP